MTNKPSSPSNKTSELKLRVISAIVLAAIVLSATWLGDKTFTFLCVAIAILVLIEFLRMCRSATPVTVRFFCYFALVLILAAWLTEQSQMAYILTAVCVVLVCVALWVGDVRKPHALCG